MTNILFVCMGNNCRYLVAAFVRKYLVREVGLEEKVYVAFAGCIVPKWKNIAKGTLGILEKYEFPS